MKNFPPLSRFAVQESLKTTPGSRSSAKFSISAALHAFTAILLCTAAGLTLLSFAAVSLPAIPSLANEPTADTENAAQTFSQTFPLNLPGQEYTAESSKGQLVGILPKHVNQNYFGWQVSRVKSQIVEENGVSFCRMSVSNALSAGPQFAIGIPKLENGKFYRLSARVRNRTEGTFAVYLREGPSPYASIGSPAVIRGTGKWEEASTAFQFFSPASDSYSIYFNLSCDGQYDLGEISIKEIPQKEFQIFQHIGNKKIIRPSAEWKNFIFSSCFPFGVPAGWNCRYGIPSVSPDVPGPSGQPALKLEPGIDERGGATLFTAPFQVPVPDKTYRLSFSYRGPGEVQCGGQTFPPSETWKRVSLDFSIPETHAGKIFEFRTSGTIWLDAVCVSEPENSEYRTAGECEIALGLPASDASLGRVQFDDEPAELLCRVMGKREGVTLKGSVTNIWGETRALPEIQLSDADEQKDLKLSYSIFPKTPLGQFRVNVQAFRNEKAVSPVSELVVSRFKRPIYWGKDAPNSPFGIHQEPIPNLLTALKAGGINWIRLHDGGFRYCSWPSVEEEKGKWTFHDDAIKTYRDHGMMLYGQLTGAPTWANYYIDTKYKPDEYRKHFAAPREECLKDFENYAYTMVKRYENEIQDWFVWNEPWGGGFFHRGYDTEKGRFLPFENQGGAYARVMEAGYRGAKRANPNVRVTGIATYGSRADFTQQIVDADGYEFCDEIDYHEYIPKTFGFPDDGNAENLRSAFLPITEKYGPIRKPIIMSEGSPLSNGSDRGSALQGIYAHVLPWENTDLIHHQADDVVRYTMSLLALDLKRVYLYTAHGHRHLMQTSFQLCLSGDGTPHTTLAALSAFAYLAEDSKFVEYQKLCEDVYAAIFERQDGSSFAVVTGKRLPRAKISCTAPDARSFDLYGNPLSLPFRYEGFLQYVTSSAGPEELKAALSAVPLLQE